MPGCSAHLQALALRHHLVTRTADSVYRLEADAYCVHDLVMGGLFSLLTAVLTLTAMFVVLLRLDWSLALLSLAVVPLLFVCLRYYSKRMVDRAQHVKELESRPRRAASTRSSPASRWSRASRASRTSSGASPKPATGR